MMTIESNKEEINKPISNVFDYLSDLNNYEVLFPQDKIENWKSILSEMAAELPTEHRKEWYRIASKDPEFLMKLTASYK